jgi:hypothetical protein
MDSVSLWRTAYASLGASLLHNAEAGVRPSARHGSRCMMVQMSPGRRPRPCSQASRTCTTLARTTSSEAESVTSKRQRRPPLHSCTARPPLTLLPSHGLLPSLAWPVRRRRPTLRHADRATLFFSKPVCPALMVGL